MASHLNYRCPKCEHISSIPIENDGGCSCNQDERNVGNTVHSTHSKNDKDGPNHRQTITNFFQNFSLNHRKTKKASRKQRKKLSHKSLPDISLSTLPSEDISTNIISSTEDRSITKLPDLANATSYANPPTYSLHFVSGSLQAGNSCNEFISLNSSSCHNLSQLESPSRGTSLIQVPNLPSPIPSPRLTPSTSFVFSSNNVLEKEQGDVKTATLWIDDNIKRSTDRDRLNKYLYMPSSDSNSIWLRDYFKSASISKEQKELIDNLTPIFESFEEMNKVFLKTKLSKDGKNTHSDLDFKKIYAVYGSFSDLPEDVQKLILKAIINCLLKDKRNSCRNDVFPYIILLMLPLFERRETYVIFAHLLRKIATLKDQDHHLIVHCLKKLDKPHLKPLVKKLNNFITYRLFPPKSVDLPSLSKCSWWIPNAAKVLALINAANNSCSAQTIKYTKFYNNSLKNLDLMAEYYTWQNPTSHPGFSFCQYPFLLSIEAKKSVLQRDSEEQMIIMARRSLVSKVQRKQIPEVGMLFLNLNVRRSHLVSDSLNEIAKKHHDLKKKLKVTFRGEPGLDLGGLTKEWFLLVVRQVFKMDYGMFKYDKKSHVFWFENVPCDNYHEYNLIGVLMGLAVYNSINLDIKFPLCCYKKLLSPPVVPFDNPFAVVGTTNLLLSDLKLIFPDLAHGLQELLDYEGNVEEDFGLMFQISYSQYGSLRTVALKPGGENIPITNGNRKDYVNLYIDYLLNKSIYQQFRAFYHGFHSVCASNALILLRPEEVEMLVCGDPDLDLSELKLAATYDGYNGDDNSIKIFWEVLLKFSSTIQKQFLFFVTGSDRVPIGGMSVLHFKITRLNNTNMLPVSHTCFNQLLLPCYHHKKVMKQKLLIAIQNAEGFGLE